MQRDVQKVQIEQLAKTMADHFKQIDREKLIYKIQFVSGLLGIVLATFSLPDDRFISIGWLYGMASFIVSPFVAARFVHQV